MSQEHDTAFPTYTAGEALEKFRLVKFSAARTVVYADAADQPIGRTCAPAASGDPVTVALLNKEGTMKMVASEAFAVNAQLYTAADGKVADTASDYEVGVAVEAASGNNSIVEVIPRARLAPAA